MIRVRMEFFGQLRDAAGAAGETVELCEPALLGPALLELARRRNLPMRGSSVNPLAPNLVSINDQLISGGFDTRSLRDGDVVTIIAPIAGG